MIKNFFFFNGCFDKARVKKLISWTLRNCGEKITIELLENLKSLGFTYATQAGISLGIDDLKIPLTKPSLILESDTKILTTDREYKQDYLTGVEKFQHLIDTWQRTSEILKQNVIQYFEMTDILNPVYMMAFSGARGNISQVRQLVGMRGLMADHKGQILDFPIKSNFREGLTLTEYIISCYGARKGLVDTALKTANSGYLTRRLVDVSHHIIVCEFDCQTKRGMLINNLIENEKIIVPLQNRLIGRILAENIYSNKMASNKFNKTHKQTEVLVLKNSLLNMNPVAIRKIQNNVRLFSLFSQFSILYFFDESQNLNEFITKSFKVPGTNSLSVFDTDTKDDSLEDFRVVRVEVATNDKKSKTVLVPKKKYIKQVKFSKKKNLSKNLSWVWNKTQGNYFPTDFIKIENQKKLDYYVNRTNKFYLYQLIVLFKHISFYSNKQELIAVKNQEISLDLAIKIGNLKKQVLVRSPLTCQIQNSICQLCYGWSLAESKLVSLGEAVGIIAAQSIGEPGTQLTMRTFHTGGVFSGDLMSEIQAPFDGIVKFSESFQGMLVRTPHGKIAFLTKVPGELHVISRQHTKLPCTKTHKPEESSFNFPSLTLLFIRNHEYVKNAQVIAEFSCITTERDQRLQANFNLNAETEGEVFFLTMSNELLKSKKQKRNNPTSNLSSIWILAGQMYNQPIHIGIFPQAGDLVNTNSLIGQYHTMSRCNGFLTVLSKTSPPLNKDKNFLPPQNFSTNTLFNKKKNNVKFLLKNTQKTSAQSNFNKQKIFLDDIFISFPIKSLQYKKVGYFFSIVHNKKSKFQLDYFFIATSLEKTFKTKLKTNFYLTAFVKQYQTVTGGILIYDNFYFKKKRQRHCGESFWIPQENYIFPTCNTLLYDKKVFDFNSFSVQNTKYVLSKPKTLPETTKWSDQTNSLILYLNSQGKISSFSSKLCGYVHINFKNSLTNLPCNSSIFTGSLLFHLQNKKNNLNLSEKLKNKKTSVPLKSIHNYLYNWRFQQSFLYKFDILGFRMNSISFSFGFLILNSQKQKNKSKITKLYFYISRCLKKHRKINKQLLTKNCSRFLQPQFPWLNSIKSSSLNSLLTTSFLTQVKTLNSAFIHEKQDNLIETFKKPTSSHLHLASLAKKSTNQSSTSLPILFPILADKKKNLMRVKIMTSWIYFPKNIKQSIQQHKHILKSGKNYCDDITFDQYPVYLECFAGPKIYVDHKKNFNKKSINLKNVLGIAHLYNIFYIVKNSRTGNLYHKVTKSEQTSIGLSCKLPYPLNLHDKNSACLPGQINNEIVDPASQKLPQKLNEWNLKFLKILDSLVSNISTITFFKKDFITGKVFKFNPGFKNKQTKNKQTKNKQTKNKQTKNKQTKNKQTKNKQIQNKQTKNKQIQNKQIQKKQIQKKKIRNYYALLLEKDIQKNTFHNFFIIRQNKTYNYEKIYFLEKIPTSCFTVEASCKVVSLLVPPLRDQQAVSLVSLPSENKYQQAKQLTKPNFNKSTFSVSLTKFNSKQSKTEKQHVLNKQTNRVSQIFVNDKNFFSFQFKMKKVFKQFSPINYKQDCLATQKQQQHLTFFFQKSFRQTQQKLKFFVFFTKVKRYSFILPLKLKQVVAQHNKSNIYLFNNCYKFNKNLVSFGQLSCFNKQTIVPLFLDLPTADFYIKPCLKYTKYKKTLLFKTSTLLEFCILYRLKPEINNIKVQFLEKSVLSTIKSQIINSFLVDSDFLKNQQGVDYTTRIKKRLELNFKSILYFNISYTRELKISNVSVRFFIINFNRFTRHTLVLFYHNFIYNHLPVSLTQIFSPHKGEILKIQKTTNETQNYLVLTKKDQISLNMLTDDTQSLKPFFGRFLGYGTQLNTKSFTPESGRIIQIEKSKIVLRKAQSILFSSNGWLVVSHGDLIEKNALVLQLFYQRLTTGDIVQGIPKIEQLLEARRARQPGIFSRNLHLELEWLFEFYLSIEKSNFQQAARRSLEKIQQIIITNVQKVYQSQGVTIAEKHLEIIVRQMTSKVQILNRYNNYIPGELLDLHLAENLNKRPPLKFDLINLQNSENDNPELFANNVPNPQSFDAVASYQTNEIKTKPDVVPNITALVANFQHPQLLYRPVVFGITRKSFHTKSFISEASFQETTRILARSAIQRKSDFLRGLKENVILGHLIPAGTGFTYSDPTHTLRTLSDDEDRKRKWQKFILKKQANEKQANEKQADEKQADEKQGNEDDWMSESISIFSKIFPSKPS